jgi:hypothetical protein
MPPGRRRLTRHAALLERWRHLPRVDGERLRRDLDDLLDTDA